MKKVNKILAALLLPALATSAYSVSFEIMPTISKAIAKTDGDPLQDDKIFFGVRGNVYINDNVAIGVGVEASTDNTMSDGGLTDLERVSLNAVYELNNGYKVRPFALAGFGGEKVHRSSPTDDDSQLFFNLGGGLKFALSDRIDLITEGKWLRKFENGDNDLIATIGLGIKLGGTTRGESVAATTVPSVTETSEVENAISLAKLREINTQKASPAPAVVTESVVTVVENVSVEPIIIEEATYVEDTNFIEDTGVTYEAISESGYYVQMAAFFDGDGGALPDRLEQKNYPYIFHSVDRKGRDATLILVGPYESKAEAAVAMKYLKRLKRDAFIYHLD